MRLGTRSQRQSGQVTLFLAGCSLGLVLLAGLSVDGGRILSAREQAWDEAQEAARAGADALSVADLRGQGETAVPLTVTLPGSGSSRRSEYETWQVTVTVTLPPGVKSLTLVLAVIPLQAAPAPWTEA